MNTLEDLKTADEDPMGPQHSGSLNGQMDYGTSQGTTPHTDSSSTKWIRGTKIGSGSFSNVYLAMSTQDGQLAAVRQIEIKGNHDEGWMQSILSIMQGEMEALKALRHQNIVSYLDCTLDHNTLNFFLEYAPCGSVDLLLRNYGAFEEALTASWARQVLQGLGHLHRHTLRHGRIRGSNVLVYNDSKVKISEAGLLTEMVEAGIVESQDTPFQESVFWMAPEVVRQAAVTIKADIWSFGCLIIEMMTAKHPFTELTPMQVIFKIGNDAVHPSIPDMTNNGRDFLQTIFQQDADARPPVAELLGHVWLWSDSPHPPVDPSGI